jgi:hypothetical protein
VTLTGPHPVELARTFLFLAARAWRRHRLRLTYAEPLRIATVELRLPTIQLGQLEELSAELQGAALRLREEAEHTLAHRVDFLGSGLVVRGGGGGWRWVVKMGLRGAQRV